MSAAGPQPAYEKTADTAAGGRSSLAHLLHALNQPLTGLQCSLELALIGPRTSEQYIRGLREGLELTGRMRVLVEAIRELADAEQDGAEAQETISVDTLLKETAEELRPVAEMREINIRVQGETAIRVEACRPKLVAVLFRFLESALSLAVPGSVFRIDTGTEPGRSWVAVCWNEGKEVPEHSPFSRQELGLLIARAGWKKIGAHWEAERSENSQRVKVVLPVVPDGNDSRKCFCGEPK
jgi:signal transduction histidine kinase